MIESRWTQRRGTTAIRMPALRRVGAVALALAALASFAAEPTLVVKRRTISGHEVLVRGFAEFDAACRLKHVQTITVVSQPGHGAVESRPGDVVIGPNWVGGGHCEGTMLRGVNVYYVPKAGYTGPDRFVMDVGYSSGRTVRAEVEVAVR